MIYRIDILGNATTDPLGEAIRQQVREFGQTVGPVTTSRVFLLDTDAAPADVQRIANELLADPIVERAEISTVPRDDAPGVSRIEIHLKPGVMDPVAGSTEMAIRDMGLSVREVRTGRAVLIECKLQKPQLQHIAERVLANGVIESVHFDFFVPKQFEAGHPYTLKLRHVEIRNLTDAQLTKLSREGHLFLSLDEMRAVQSYYREQNREPTDVELETIAQTWSEHCVHKTLKSAVDVEVRDESGNAIGHRRYGNLIKETIFQSTVELMNRHGRDAHATQGPLCLSVFKDNAGVIAFDDSDAVCFKVETHNHPSAIEPYGGSATGVGGVIRDILGTGLAARPIANTDVFCVAYPDLGNKRDGSSSFSANKRDGSCSSSIDVLPTGVIHPKRVLQQVVAGVRDYGNRMGIPTINGAIYFDDRYIGNPLVFCGCVGIIPRDKIEKEARKGDAIVVMGGRTGRDGIHGATFSSAELTDTHADEFSHAVQIGNAITEKKVSDVILQARDRGLFSAVTDCGAGGLSSAVGEMGEKLGAYVELHKVPLKYAGLRYDEIWISEAQERMVLSVPPQKVAELLALSEEENVESTVIGHFGTDDAELVLMYETTEVGRMSMHFLHDGIPMPTRKAVVVETSVGRTGVSPVAADDKHGRDAHGTKNAKDQLLALLAHPNIASKHWIIRQYDHEVQGGSVIKPLVGPLQIGPSDASVIRPKLGSNKGVVIACGMAPHVEDPYQMALASIDEAIRNLVAVGGDPSRTAILDNFCWPSVDTPELMGTLVRACEACRDAALAYGIPFISGKDSLHNQFTNSETGEVIRIPNTLLISAIGVIDDVNKCITMDFKQPDSTVALVRPSGDSFEARIDLHRRLSRDIAAGRVLSCHDISDGGTLVAAAEMCIASGLGLKIDLSKLAVGTFDEMVGGYLIEISGDGATPLELATDLIALGRVSKDPSLDSTGDDGFSIPVADLTAAWRGTLDW